ncbi:hypothetical protein AHAS_Ahas13G0399500 [Arachis hypogaea]
MTITINKNGKKECRKDCINLVGKIVVDIEISFKGSKNALLGIWRNLKDIFISEVGKNKLLVSLRDQKRGLQILKGALVCQRPPP